MTKDQLIWIPILILAGTFHGTQNGLHLAGNKKSSRKQFPILINFPIFTGKYLCQSLSFNEVTGMKPTTLFKKRLWHRCFPVNFGIFLRTFFSWNTCGGCFLKSSKDLLSIRVPYTKNYRIGFALGILVLYVQSNVNPNSFILLRVFIKNTRLYNLISVP